MKEFLLFDSIPGNICTVYQKEVNKGEHVRLDKWGLVVW
jgi:hypothetical protein